MKRITSFAVMLCALCLVNMARAGESKSVVQKSNGVALDATTLWLSHKIASAGGYEFTTKVHRFVESYSEVKFEKGVCKLSFRRQMFVGEELMRDETAEISFSLKRFDSVVVESENIGQFDYNSVVLRSQSGDKSAVQTKTTILVDKMREVDEKGNEIKKSPRANPDIRAESTMSFSFTDAVDAQTVAASFQFAMLLAKDSA